MINNVTLVGRITADPVTKVIGEGTSVVNFTLAVNRPYKDEIGEYQADFIMCQAWNQKAEFIGSYVKKGDLLGITGSINTRTYEKDEVTHYVTEVNVNHVQSLQSKKEAAPSFTTVEEVQDAWRAEWDKKSVGLDAKAKATLKKQLEAKYQPQIAALEDLPF